MWVQPPCQEDALEKDMATYSGILVWRILRTEDPGGLQSMGSHKVVDYDFDCNSNEDV